MIVATALRPGTRSEKILTATSASAALILSPSLSSAAATLTFFRIGLTPPVSSPRLHVSDANTSIDPSGSVSPLMLVN